MKIDKIIFGDNQFFGINHMSEAKAAASGERFRDNAEIIKVIDWAYNCGIHAFMFCTHDRVEGICDHFRANPKRYKDLSLYPAMPYAHKYANAVAEKGMIGALTDVLVKDNSARNILSMISNAGKGVLTQNPYEIMKVLVDAEMKMFRGLHVKAIFLQNIVTDLLLGYGVKDVAAQFAEYVREKYNAEPGFITQNLPTTVDFLEESGVKNPVVCAGINKIGYLMNPSQELYEKYIAEKEFQPMAMSMLASGAVGPQDAVDYIASLQNVKTIVFGASSKGHIEQTKQLIDEKIV